MSPQCDHRSEPIAIVRLGRPDGTRFLLWAVGAGGYHFQMDGMTELSVFNSEKGLDLTGVGLDEWRQIGSILNVADANLRWAVGDWILYGEITFDNPEVVIATALDGWTQAQLANAVTIAEAFPPGPRRRLDLVPTHSYEVAHLPPEMADEILAQASAERWSTRPDSRRGGRRSQVSRGRSRWSAQRDHCGR